MSITPLALRQIQHEASPSLPGVDSLEHITAEYDPSAGILRYSILPDPLPCFTEGVLNDLAKFQGLVDERMRTGDFPGPLKYLVAVSGSTGFECLGGDLGFFLKAIATRDRESLLRYSDLGIRVLHRNYEHLSWPLTTIALLKGATLGAGLEAALSCDVIVAEKGVRVGFPEVMFNMFPGMGAIGFLNRRIAPALAERMVLSGKLYPVEELYEWGLVDHLADPRRGNEKLRRVVRELDRTQVTRGALSRFSRRLNPVTLAELRDTALHWVDSALQLSERDLGNMARLLRAQGHKFGASGDSSRTVH